jgi:hypothetical protein
MEIFYLKKLFFFFRNHSLKFSLRKKKLNFYFAYSFFFLQYCFTTLNLILIFFPKEFLFIFCQKMVKLVELKGW